MATYSLVKNSGLEPLTLPFPYAQIIAPGKSVVVEDTPANVNALIGKVKSAHVSEFDSAQVGGASVAATANPAGTPFAVSSATALMFNFVDPDAPAVAGVHAVVLATAPNAFPGPLTQPDMPRNLSVTFESGWDGGAVTVTGTDQFDTAITESFAYSAGTVNGTKMFKTVTGVAKATIGVATKTASVGTGGILGIPQKAGAVWGVLFADTVAEAVTISTANSSFTPTTAPDGSTTYTLFVNILP